MRQTIRSRVLNTNVHREALRRSVRPDPRLDPDPDPELLKGSVRNYVIRNISKNSVGRSPQTKQVRRTVHA